MKKIFTLVFSLGLLTSAFAQSEHRQQRQNQDNTYQSSQYSRGNGQDNNNSNAYSYGKNSQWNNNHDEFAYNRDNDKFDRDKNFRNGDERFDSRYKKQRGYGNDYGYAQPVRVPLLQIIFGIGRR